MEKLNQLTADLTGITVYAGPSEATAIGNLIIQMLTKSELDDLDNARRLIAKSFTVKKFKPKKIGRYKDV